MDLISPNDSPSQKTDSPPNFPLTLPSYPTPQIKKVYAVISNKHWLIYNSGLDLHYFDADPDLDSDTIKKCHVDPGVRE